ncbi:MAG TPA: selenium-dependent molybdenum cofactor biosynthesis protein YqeB [Bacillota bacterium]|nr:selenium-dependent molybdenum cofactor biosynthesis protein YqeB [Bacillota bacterium]
MSGLTVLIRGGGDLASAAVYKLKRSGMRVVVCEIARPTCVRRTVSFCNAIYEGDWEIQGITSRHIEHLSAIEPTLKAGFVPVLTIPDREVRDFLKPDVFIDATISKKTPDYDTSWAPLVIGLGPSIVAGVHAHVVIETQRGHDLGSLIYAGEASPNTGIPGDIAGYQMERVLRAPRNGLACHHFRIGDHVNAGDTVMTVGGAEVKAAISGVLRGLIAPGLTVSEGQKIGDIDPRDNDRYCWSISDKGRNIAGGVLEAIMAFFASPN